MNKWLIVQTFLKEATLKNANVEKCVTNSILHWRFPSPKGGGIVAIEYPFVFNAGSK